MIAAAAASPPGPPPAIATSIWDAAGIARAVYCREWSKVGLYLSKSQLYECFPKDSGPTVVRSQHASSAFDRVIGLTGSQLIQKSERSTSSLVLDH